MTARHFKALVALSAGLIGASSVAHATEATTSGVITVLESSTVLQADSRAQNVFLLQLNAALSNSCVYGWISATDKTTQALATAAKVSGATVSLRYDNTIPSPWGDSTICGIILMVVN